MNTLFYSSSLALLILIPMSIGKIEKSDNSKELKVPHSLTAKKNYARELKKLDEHYKIGIQLAKKRYLDDLKASMKEALKSENLELANLINKEIEQVKKGGDPSPPIKKMIKIKVPANHGIPNPLKVTPVRRGDRITIRPIKGKWSGGGSKAKQFCDWKGYPAQPKSRHTADRFPLTWMSLRASIDKDQYLISSEKIQFTALNSGSLRLFCFDPDPKENQGDIEVEISIE